MALLDELTEQLAKDVVAAMDELGDDRFYDKVSKVLLDASPNTQEAFMTAIRALLAERRARKFLDDALAAKRTGSAAPKAPYAGDSH